FSIREAKARAGPLLSSAASAALAPIAVIPSQGRHALGVLGGDLLCERGPIVRLGQQAPVAAWTAPIAARRADQTLAAFPAAIGALRRRQWVKQLADLLACP